MKKFLRRLIFLILLIIIIIFGVIYFNGNKLYKSILEEKSIKAKIAEVKKDDSYVSYKDVPDYYLNAIVAVEDHRFKEHGPVDYIAILRAIVSNAKAKDFNEGGSTITQQVAKNLFLISEEDYISRKVAEILISIDLEKEYSKEEILELYINTIYFGEGYYGIKEAANGYYDKEPIDLDLNEATILAGVPNAPSVYNPRANYSLAKNRQGKVLRDMVEYGYLSQEEANKILNAKE